MKNQKRKGNDGGPEHKEREAVTIPKCPGSVESAGYRKTTQDFGFSVAVSQEHLKYLFAIQERINHYFVVMLVPVESRDQAEYLCSKSDDPENDAIPIPGPDPGPLKPDCSVDELARLFNVTTRYIQKLASTGVVHQIARGRYDLPRSIQGYIDHLRNTGRGNGTSAVAEERAMLIRTTRESKELDLRVKRGELVETEAVRQAMATEYTNLKKTLDGLPVKLAVAVPLKYRPTVRDEAERIINEGLSELSGSQPEAPPVRPTKPPAAKKKATKKKKTARAAKKTVNKKKGKGK